MVVLLREKSQKNTEELRTLTIFSLTLALFWPVAANYKSNSLQEIKNHKRYHFIPSDWKISIVARSNIDRNISGTTSTPGGDVK